LLPQSEVTAVIVTRGDVPLQPVIDSLIFDNVVIWDNSKEAKDQMTYGRLLGALRAPTEVIYSQDDDIVHSPQHQEHILAAYSPTLLVGCMWKEWSNGARAQGIENGYDDLVFPGSGSIGHRALWIDAHRRYLEHYPHDDFFRLWSDTIIGVISPTVQLPLRFEELDWGNNANRMAHMDDAVALKTEAIRRAREVRDGVLV
jgi:sulfur carrier protein ThiS